MLPEEVILNLFDCLEPQDRTPRNFVRTINLLSAGMPITLSDAVQSWKEVREQFRVLPFCSLPGEREFRANCAAIFKFALEIHAARQGITLDGGGTSHTVSFCRYCWRLGNTVESARGFADRKRPQATDTHAFCRFHEADAVKIARKRNGETVVQRKVRNQREIQKARKVARSARWIERLVIVKDRRDARLQKRTPCWISGDSIIEGRDDLWPEFVSHFFPHIAHNITFSRAMLSPLDAFRLLEDGNAYEGMQQTHAAVSSDKRKLAFYLMPMMLRLDVCLEVETEIANKKRRKKVSMLERTVWSG